MAHLLLLCSAAYMHPLDIHWIYTLGSVALIAALSFIGMLALSVSPHHLSRIIPIMVSLAAGALLGTAFGHLLPESVERVGSGRELAGLLLAGFVTFFVLEKILGVWCNRYGARSSTIAISATAIFIYRGTPPRCQRPRRIAAVR